MKFLYEDEDLTAKERAHRIFPMFEDISDEEWMRRAAPLHYPYHTPASQKAYDEEMAWRNARRKAEWEAGAIEYKKYQRRIRRNERAKVKALDPEDFSDCDSFASAESFDSNSSIGSTSAEEVLEKLCNTLRSLYKNGIKPSAPSFKRALQRAADVNRIINDDSDSDSITTSPQMRRLRALPDPNWNIKLDENMILTILDFDNDPFLTPADEEGLDNVQACFNTRDIRIAEEIICRLPKLINLYGKDKHQIKKDEEEYARLMILYKRVKERLDAAYGISSDGQRYGDDDSQDYTEDPEDSEDAQDDETASKKPKDSKSGGDGDDSKDPENQPDWLRKVSKKPRLIIEAPDMDVNPNYVNLSPMNEEEGEDHFARRRELAQAERELLETENERKERIAHEIKQKGNDIQWLHTRDREDFPTLARVSTSTQPVSPPIPTEGAFASRQFHERRSLKLTPRLFDGQTMKCFSAGPQHTDEVESIESSSASSVKKKSLAARAVKKIEKKIKRLRRKAFRFVDDNVSEITLYRGPGCDSD